MKKVLFGILAVTGSLFATKDAAAQKVGVFDVDIMVQAMPGYRNVDSLVQIYERDSLSAEYDFTLKEYNRLDSTYKRDSADRKAASVLNYIKQQRNEMATSIIYWQQISQQKSEGKRQQMASPLYDRVLTAYSAVLQKNNYLIILKPGAFEMGSKVENVFEKVAKELKITLPEQLRSNQPEPAEEAPANKPPVKTTPKPGVKKQ